MKRPDGRICIGGARRRDPACSWFTSEWEGPSTQPGSDSDSELVAPVSARLRKYLAQLLGNYGEELVVESEWTGVLGFTLDGKPLVGPMPRWGGRVFAGVGYNGHGMPACSGVGQALASQMAAAEGHDVTALSRPAEITEYVASLSPERFASLA